jgi:hypothetical protein
MQERDHVKDSTSCLIVRIHLRQEGHQFLVLAAVGPEALRAAPSTQIGDTTRHDLPGSDFEPPIWQPRVRLLADHVQGRCGPPSTSPASQAVAAGRPAAPASPAPDAYLSCDFSCSRGRAIRVRRTTAAARAPGTVIPVVRSPQAGGPVECCWSRPQCQWISPLEAWNDHLKAHPDDVTLPCGCHS